VILDGLGIDELRLAAVCQRYGVAVLTGFGPMARGAAGPDSDLDQLYQLLPDRHLGWEIEDLQDELSGSLGRDVDLVSRTVPHERLRSAVLAEAQPVYAA